MREYKNIKEYLSKIKNPYEMRIGDTIIKLEYSEDGKKFNECMLNILKSRMNRNSI